MANVIRPDHEGEEALPESQMEKADREEPGSEPQASSEAVLLDADFLSGLFGLVGFQSTLLEISSGMARAQQNSFPCRRRSDVERTAEFGNRIRLCLLSEGEFRIRAGIRIDANKDRLR